ncbi:MAG TPA: autotransporter assembly complex family protein [Pelomicrobium sp.]|nr:autotransporter assembly complex family protein [Pelomicrobium sp.]
MIAGRCAAWKRQFVAALAAFLAALPAAWGAESRFAVRIDAPERFQALLQDNLRIVRRVQEGVNERQFERLSQRAERDIRELLATEGYFSPTVELTVERGADVTTAHYRVLPGEPSIVTEVALEFRGALVEDRWNNAERRELLRESWPLREGQRFRQRLWDAGKSGLVRLLVADRYPLAELAQSEARVDPEARTVKLHVVVDSGPSVTLGEVRIEGLERYPESIVRDLNRIPPGTPFSQELLSDYQRDLLETSYFASAFVTADVDAKRPDNAPIQVTVVEAPLRRVKLGIGFSTDIGFKVEGVYTQRDFFGRPWQWNTGARIAQREQIAFTEVITPRNADGHRYGVGVLTDRQDVQGEVTTSISALLRRLTPGRTQEMEIGLAPIYERKQVEDVTTERLKSLPVYASWTRRNVDDLLNPRSGWLLNLRGAAALEGILTDESFVQGAAKAAAFVPFGRRDTLALRAELGRTWASNPESVPSRYLFRTGGTSTVRGYAFESLGVPLGNAIVGGRILGVASAEYTHMFTEQWGAAAFIDAGDAADSLNAFDAKLGYGAGVRWNTPIGPLALDLAYGRDVSEYRVHLTVGFAF